MAIKLFSPAVICVREWLSNPEDKVEGLTPEYFQMLKDEMDAMRTRDREGRRRSNKGLGWQSNDGIDNNPIFNKLMRQIKRTVTEEIMGYCGFERGTAQCVMHNSWGNINYPGGYNAPHLHNGCTYSGACYIRADGDEGDIKFIETTKHYVGMALSSPRMEESWGWQPKTGDILLFPSGTMHMVEPNTTDKDRYSISFNIEISQPNGEILIEENGEEWHKENMGLVFKTDRFGKLIQ